MSKQNPLINLALSSNALQQTLESFTIPLSKYPEVCGIDEAGRGCIAGSLFVCGVVLESPIQSLLERIKDSKKLSQSVRDSLSVEIQSCARFHIVQKTSKQIDEKGLSVCIKESLLEILSSLNAPFYVFDGNCAFGIPHLKTLVKGDSKLHTISAASILAKSVKDSEMLALHKEFPQYDFAHNKGYGTKAHLEKIQKCGFCPVHRQSYRLKSLLTPSLF